jgi:hypothetical protein
MAKSYSYTEDLLNSDSSKIIRVQTDVNITETILSITDNPDVPLPVDSTFNLSTVPFSDPDIIGRQGAGLNAFYENSNGLQTNFPLSGSTPVYKNNDRRFNWNEVETGLNTYNWSVINDVIKLGMRNGWKTRFGMIPVNSNDGGMKYPSYLHTQMQVESVKDYQVGGTWVPNWNSNSYLTAVERFLQAMVAQLKATNYTVPSGPLAGKTFSLWVAVAGIDKRFFGNFGEGHYYGIGDDSPLILATSASLKRIAQAHITYVTDKPLFFNLGELDDNSHTPVDYRYWLVTASNGWGKLGIRTDHIGWINTNNYDLNQTATYNGLKLVDEAKRRWKVSPFIAEPMNDVGSVTNSVAGAGPHPWWDLVKECKDWGISEMSNTNVAHGNSQGDDAWRFASKTMGYRLGLKSVRVLGLTATLTWINEGIAPVYENWDVYLIVNGGLLQKSATNLRTILPGTSTVIDTLPHGIYTLSVIIKDPQGYRDPMVLINTGRQSDGSYIIGAVNL